MRESELITAHLENKKKGIYSYTMESQSGVKVVLTNYGAAIYRIIAPDREGNKEDIALSCQTVEAFMRNTVFFGATIGRVANRIKEGKIKIGEDTFLLSQNEGRKHAHGGYEGFDKKVWSGKITHNAVEFTYVSPDGEEGYPGNAVIIVTYRLSKEGALKIEYEAESSEDTIINLTNHTYFNLSGYAAENIYGQKLKIYGGFYLESDKELIPTGQILDVRGTPFDFTQEKELGVDIHAENPMIFDNQGYDVTFLKENRGYAKAAILKDEKTGRCLEVFTDYPAIHLYTGNFLDNELGLAGKFYNQHESVCLEAQRCPFAIGYAHFGEIVLKAGEKMKQSICYQFSAER